MIDEQQALTIAAEALKDWGVSGTPHRRALPGGWRCWCSTGPAGEVQLGNSHVLVRRSDGAVLRCPSGAPDPTAARILRDADPPASN